MDEYIENLDTPVIRRYSTLSDVPGDAKAFVLRYEHYINTHPTRVESWGADIARAHLTLSDTEESPSLQIYYRGGEIDNYPFLLKLEYQEEKDITINIIRMK